MPRGFISLGRKGNYINVDYIIDYNFLDDGRVVLKDIYGCKWTVDSKLIKGKLKDE